MEETEQLQELFATHRRTLMHLLDQAAAYGGETLAPPQVAAGIAQAREEIARLKPVLRASGVHVQDLPIDSRLDHATVPPAPVRGGINIRIGNQSSVGGSVVANTGTITTYNAPATPSPLEAAVAAVKTAQASASAHGNTDLAADLQPALFALETARTAQSEGKHERYQRKIADARATLEPLAANDSAVAEAARLLAGL